jgi:hypothetical protein
MSTDWPVKRDFIQVRRTALAPTPRRVIGKRLVSRDAGPPLPAIQAVSEKAVWCAECALDRARFSPSIATDNTR